MKENKGFRIFGLDEKIKTKFKDVAGNTPFSLRFGRSENRNK